VELTGIEPATS